MKFLTRCPLLLFDVAREKDNFPARNCEKSKKSKEIFPMEEKGTHNICNNFFLANHKLHKDKTMAKLVILIPLTVNNAFYVKLAIIEHDPINAN